MTMIRALCLLLCLNYVSCKAIKFEACGGNVTEVRVDPCPTEPCAAVKGKSIHIEADFISNQNAKKLRLWVGAEIVKITLPLPGLKRNACIGRNISCPLSVGDKQTFVFDLNILPAFPTLEANTHFEITGTENEEDKDKILLCFKAPVKIIKQ